MTLIPVKQFPTGKMNLDQDYSALSEGDYPYASNIRFVSDESGNTVFVEYIRGNQLAFQLPSVQISTKRYEVRFSGSPSSGKRGRLLFSEQDDINGEITFDQTYNQSASGDGFFIHQEIVDFLSNNNWTPPVAAEPLQWDGQDYHFGIVSSSPTFTITELLNNTLFSITLISERVSNDDAGKLIPVASHQLRGKLYILSTTRTDEQGGLGEIGVWDGNSYQTLMRSSEFGMTTAHKISGMHVEEDEKRTSVYWTDGHQPYRVWYSDFDYITGQIDQQTNALQNRAEQAEISFQRKLNTGGNLPPGVWRYYARFLNDRRDPAQLIEGQVEVPTYHSNGITQSPLLDMDENTTQANQISITNIDPTYSYVEIYGVKVSGAGSYQAFVLTTIDTTNTSSVNFIHTGNEEAAPVDISEFFLENVQITRGKCLTTIDNRMVYSNVEVGANEEEMEQFKKAADQIGWLMVEETMDDLVGFNNLRDGEYLNIDNYQNKRTFMPGESYRTAVQFRTKSGTITPWFFVANVQTQKGISPGRFFYILRQARFTNLFQTDAWENIEEARFGFSDYEPEVLFGGLCVPMYNYKPASNYPYTIPKDKDQVAPQLTGFPFDAGQGQWNMFKPLQVDVRDIDNDEDYRAASFFERSIKPNYYAMFSPDINMEVFDRFQTGDRIQVGQELGRRGEIFYNQHLNYQNTQNEDGRTSASFMYNFMARDASFNERIMEDAQLIRSGEEKNVATESMQSFLDIGDRKVGSPEGRLSGAIPDNNSDYWAYNRRIFFENCIVFKAGNVNRTKPFLGHYRRNLISKFPENPRYNPMTNWYSRDQINAGEQPQGGADAFVNTAFTEYTFNKEPETDRRYRNAIAFPHFTRNPYQYHKQRKGFEEEGLFPWQTDAQRQDYFKAAGIQRPRYVMDFRVNFPLLTKREFDPDNTDQFSQRHIARSYYSDLKTSGFGRDFYRQVLPLNFKDFDVSKGEITNTKNLNGSLFVWQEHAFIQQPFNTRAIVTSEDGEEVFLGSGTVMGEKHRTLSKYGCRHLDSVVVGSSVRGGKDVAFWINTEYGRMLRFGHDGTLTISEGGLKSFMSNHTKIVHNHDNPVHNMGLHGTYDHRFNEAIFTVRARRTDLFTFDNNIPYPQGSVLFWQGRTMRMQGVLEQFDDEHNNHWDDTGEIIRFIRDYNPGDWNDLLSDPKKYFELIPRSDYNYYNEFTVAFSQSKAGYSTFYVFHPHIYMQLGDSILSERPDNTYDTVGTFRGAVYEHNKGNRYGSFYAQGEGDDMTEQRGDFEIEMVINIHPDTIKRYMGLMANTHRMLEHIVCKTKDHETFMLPGNFEDGDIIEREGMTYCDIKNNILTSSDGLTNSEDTERMTGRFVRIHAKNFPGEYQKLINISVNLSLNHMFHNQRQQ